MKNLKIYQKLMMCFAATVALAVSIGIMGIYNVHVINREVEEFFAKNSTTAEVAKLSEEMLAHIAVQSNVMTIETIVIVAIAAAVSVFMCVYLSASIGGAMKFLAGVLKSIAKTGNMLLDDGVSLTVKQIGERKDEAGQITEAAEELLNMINRKVKVLDAVAEGNLGHKFVHRSDRDTFSIEIQKMVDNLDSMFRDIVDISNEVVSGGEHLAESSQILADGSVRQTAAMDKLCDAIGHISSMTGEYADKSHKAAGLGNQIKVNAETGSSQMEYLMQAVQGINEASVSIKQVIKVINDIAFQTNILALNAAVEAARAGQHGKGFAVVADEVRNLAAKSAEAANNTESLIANSIEKAELCVNIAGETSASLSKIVEGINETSEVINDIAHSSEQQTNSITDINSSIEQVAQVVQQNSAIAQQIASSSQQMRTQSSLLQQSVGRFKLKEIA